MRKPNQTGLIENAHHDLVTDIAYDFYGLRLATCGLDQRIKVYQLDESNGTWAVHDDWKAHDAAVSKLCWAHPEFGSIIASSSFDRTVKVWEQTSTVNSQVNGEPTSRWVERATLSDARGSVRAVEFAPHHFGLKLATISTDNTLRFYECLEQSALTTWQLAEEVDMMAVPASAPAFLSRAHTMALATPTQNISSDFGASGPSASLVAQALAAQTHPFSQARSGTGNREADGGWCLSWCKDRYWGEIIAVGSGIDGTVKIIQLNPSRRPTTLVTLDPLPQPVAQLPTSNAQNESGIPSQTADAIGPVPQAVTSVSWAPSCGRSYHLIATGGRDGHVRIWKIKAGSTTALDDELPRDEDEMDLGTAEDSWSPTVVADFDEHKLSVGRVEWNITGTVLSSAGNDGRVRLWKATSGNVWRPAGSLGVEQQAEDDQKAPRKKEEKKDTTDRDVEMDR